MKETDDGETGVEICMQEGSVELNRRRHWWWVDIAIWSWRFVCR